MFIPIIYQIESPRSIYENTTGSNHSSTCSNVRYACNSGIEYRRRKHDMANYTSGTNATSGIMTSGNATSGNMAGMTNLTNTTSP